MLTYSLANIFLKQIYQRMKNTLKKQDSYSYGKLKIKFKRNLFCATVQKIKYEINVLQNVYRSGQQMVIKETIST